MELLDPSFSNSPVEWKFIDCGESVKQAYKEALETYFKDDPTIREAKIRFIFYSKQKKVRGNVAFAYVKKPSDFESYLDSRSDPNGEPANYFMFIDYYVWNNIEKEYQLRLMRHELRHIDIDYDKNGDLVFGLKDHDFQDFEVDIDYENNQEDGDVKWGHVLLEASINAYEEVEEKKKEMKDSE